MMYLGSFVQTFFRPAGQGTIIGNPRLPLELEREIFELAALANRRDIPALLRVAHHVCDWIEPLLYTSIEINKPSAVVLHNLQHTRPPPCIAAVRQIIVYEPDAILDLASFLSCCVRVTHVAITPVGSGYGQGLPLLLQKLPRLQRLVLSFTHAFPDESEAYPHLPHVTHLELLDELAPTQTTRLAAFVGGFPALTHLALNHHSPAAEDALLTALLNRRTCPQLRVLCCISPGETEVRALAMLLELKYPSPPSTSPLRDRRLVLVDYGWWFEGAMLPAAGRKTYWDKADVFVERKARGDVEPLALSVFS
ncbi:hypothetical protein MIND_00629900 [Mycena indigotica]|uniref:F-box domain-containing protein n=1 Tax=Mycena indigotica TaxID=2126181 RepID=A0A8H6W391_9AGAR|nr:uncharacterized protein MIND_00629900 [Mycena indigotica]KAF7303989.1 hypothetical protein MIND_00629900 [Mycena indigotica]